MKLKEPENLNYAATKKCPKCSKILALDRFTKSKYTRSGYKSWCKGCSNEGSLKRHHELMRNPEYRLKRREISLRYRYKHKYGITIEDKQIMIDSQNGLCEMCSETLEFSTAKVDHNHLTGAVRGILCNRCNSGLAYIEDDQFMNRGKEYIRKYEIKRT